MEGRAPSELIVRFRTSWSQRLVFFLAQARFSKLVWLFVLVVAVSRLAKVVTATLPWDARLRLALVSLVVTFAGAAAAVLVLALVVVSTRDEDEVVLLTETEARYVSGGVERKIAWDQATQLRRVGGCFYLGARSSPTFVAVPRSAFADDLARARFEETVRKRLAEARA